MHGLSSCTLEASIIAGITGKYATFIRKTNLSLSSSFSFHLGQSINPKFAGLIGRHGPQNKQPFTVAFFKATEVHFRSIRSTGGKQRNQNRSKAPKNQEAFRVSNLGGTQTLGV